MRLGLLIIIQPTTGALTAILSLLRLDRSSALRSDQRDPPPDLLPLPPRVDILADCNPFAWYAFEAPDLPPPDAAGYGARGFGPAESFDETVRGFVAAPMIYDLCLWFSAIFGWL